MLNHRTHLGRPVRIGQCCHVGIYLPVPGTEGRSHNGVPVQARLQPHGLLHAYELRGQSQLILLLYDALHGLPLLLIFDENEISLLRELQVPSQLTAQLLIELHAVESQLKMLIGRL